MIEVRYFTTSGRQQWRDWINEVKQVPTAQFPSGMLEDASLTVGAAPGVAVSRQKFDTKYELVKALLPAVQALEASQLPADKWPGVWDWLAALYIDSICPATGAQGTRTVLQLERYVWVSDWNRTYRHRIFGPVDLYKKLGEPSRLLIHGLPSKLSDWEEQAAARYALKGNPGVAQTLFDLYWDPEKAAPKRGAAPNKKKPGTLRRFGDLMLQLDRTYDLLGTSHRGMHALLPKEYDKFKPREDETMA